MSMQCDLFICYVFIEFANLLEDRGLRVIATSNESKLNGNHLSKRVSDE